MSKQSKTVAPSAAVASGSLVGNYERLQVTGARGGYGRSKRSRHAIEHRNPAIAYCHNCGFMQARQWLTAGVRCSRCNRINSLRRFPLARNQKAVSAQVTNGHLGLVATRANEASNPAQVEPVRQSGTTVAADREKPGTLECVFSGEVAQGRS